MLSPKTYGATYERLNSGNGSPATESRLLANISTNTQTVSSNVSRLEWLVRQIGGGRDNPSLRNELASVENDTREVATLTVGLIRDLALQLQKGHTSKKARRQQMNRLHNELKMAVSRFREVMQSYRDKYEVNPEPEEQRHHLAMATPTSTQTSFIEGPEDEWNQELRVVETREIAYELSVAEERARRMKEIEQDIRAIQQLFRQLSNLVNEQGEVIDDIGANIEGAATDVEAATRELGKSFHFQRTRRIRLCCLLLIVLVIAIAVILAVVLSVDH